MLKDKIKKWLGIPEIEKFIDQPELLQVIKEEKAWVGEFTHKIWEVVANQQAKITLEKSMFSCRESYSIKHGKNTVVITESPMGVIGTGYLLTATIDGDMYTHYLDDDLPSVVFNYVKTMYNVRKKDKNVKNTDKMA